MVYKTNQLSPESEHYLQQLEGAILNAASTGSQESSQRLDAERCQRPDGLAGACLELLRRRGWGDAAGGGCPAQHDAVAFYALTTLQRSPLLSCLPPGSTSSSELATLRSQLRSLLLATISHVPNLQSMPQFVVTKIAVILALIVREDYPTNWTRPLGDVMGAMNLSSIEDGSALHRLASVGMYLSFLDAISDEIVYPAADDDGDRAPTQCSSQGGERMRREQVKDALRGFAINEANQATTAPLEPCVPLEQTDTANIVGWLLSFVVAVTNTQQASRQDGNANINQDGALALAVRAVATLKRYLSWIDMRLAANQALVQILLSNLGGASSQEEGGDEPTQRTLLAVECAHGLREIVDRGMDEQKKLLLLSELSVFDTLCRLSRIEVGAVSNPCQVGKLDLTSIDGTQIEAVAAAAELINTAGLELIQGWELDSTSRAVNLQMEQCLELALACLSYDSIDVSGAVVDLVSRILVSIEKKEGMWGSCFGVAANGDSVCNAILSRILLILNLRMAFPPDFEFDYEDEEEAEEELYRAQLRKLFQRIVRLRPQTALQFISERLSSLPQPLSTCPTSEMEVALRLVYHYGEGAKLKSALKDASFREIVMALHRSDVSSHPHREVLLLYYDLSVRYSAILKESPELLAMLLGSISGNKGLQHPHARVRCRCCYLLLRLIKSVGAVSMRPHVEAVVDGIQTLLFPPAQAEFPPIPPDEALYLFEATGILLGTTGLGDDIQVRCATAVLTPHIRAIEQTLRDPDLHRDIETFGEQLSMNISAIAQLSKGWQSHPPPGVQAVLAAAVEVVRNVLVALPSSPLIRSRTSVLLQRMILCLGEGILPMMPSFFDPLISHCTLEDDVLDTSQLINQLCIKFKGGAYAAIDSAILPFLQKVLTVQTGGGIAKNGDNGIVPPHLVTEQLSIRKQAFSTLQHIAVHDVSVVLYSKANVAAMGDILQLMNDGATTVPDPVMKKTCTMFFSELILRWGSGSDAPPAHVNNAFFEFVYAHFVPQMMRTILGSAFNVKDALQCRVLSEFSRALWFLKQSERGNAEFQSRVVEAIVGGAFVDGSPGIATGFMNASCSKDIELVVKKWKEELKQ